MSVYDLRCTGCDLVFKDVVMTYEEMKAAKCPACESELGMIPGGFSFEVQGSKVKERQKLERRFKKRQRRIEKTFTPQQKARFERFCDRYHCRKSY